MKIILLIFIIFTTSLITALQIQFNSLNDDLNEIEEQELTKEKQHDASPWNEFFWTTESVHEILATTQKPDILRKRQALEREINNILKDFHKNLTDKEALLLKQVDDTYQTYLNKLGTGSCREEAEMKLSAIKDVTLDFYYNCIFRLSNPKIRILNIIERRGEILRKNINLDGKDSPQFCQSFVDINEKKICHEKFKTQYEEAKYTYQQQLVTKFKFYASFYVELWSRKTTHQCFDFENTANDFYSAIKMCLGTSSLSYYS